MTKLTNDNIKTANDILLSRGETKQGLALKLGLARSTVTNFFMGRHCSKEVYKSICEYLEIENANYHESILELDINGSSQISVYEPANIEELKVLSEYNLPELRHLFTCHFFDYCIAHAIFVTREIILSAIQKNRLPSTWCGYTFVKGNGGYQIKRLI